MNKKIKVVKREHNVWKEMKQIEKISGLKSIMRELIGQNHYLYSKGNREISMIRMSWGFSKKWYYEIYCLEGNLFKDVERLDTKKEAEKRIEFYLTKPKIIIKLNKINEELKWRYYCRLIRKRFCR